MHQGAWGIEKENTMAAHSATPSSVDPGIWLRRDLAKTHPQHVPWADCVHKEQLNPTTSTQLYNTTCNYVSVLTWTCSQDCYASGMDVKNENGLN